MCKKETEEEIRHMKIDTANIKTLAEFYSLDTELLVTLWDGIPALMFCKDDKNTMLKVNQPLADMIGLSKYEIEGENASNLMKDVTGAANYLANDVSVLSTGKAKNNIYEKLFDTGLRVRTDKFPIRKDGKIIGILGFSIILND